MGSREVKVDMGDMCGRWGGRDREWVYGDKDMINVFSSYQPFIVPGEAAQEFERERDLVADIMVGNGEEMHVGR